MGQKNNNIKTGKWKQLSEQERYQIEILIQTGLSAKEIGKQLGRDRRTIEREIQRGSIEQRDSQWRKRIVYCADVGQRVHNERSRNKGRPLKIGHDHKLAEYIERKISKEKFSPDAVIGRIKAKNKKFDVSICTKTLYNYIEKMVFRNITNKDLPVKKSKKKHNHKKIRAVALNNLKGCSIDLRPDDIEKRKDLGHWEMDCVLGKEKSCLLVMTERKSRKELIFQMDAKKQSCVKGVLDRLEKRYKSKYKDIFKSITMDNGSEFLNFQGLETSCLNSKYKRTKCYYAHPYSAWERGSNEVANKLIRRFVSKGADIGKLKRKDILRIQHWMNNYPRKIFGYMTANEIYAT